MEFSYRSINNIPLGRFVRNKFGTQYIFRVRRGNGAYGSVVGKLYQDKLTYFIPSSINNPEGQTARNALATAVNNWKTVLSDEEKAKYNHRADLKGNMSGFNLYIGEYVKENA